MARTTVLTGGVAATIALLTLPAVAHEHPSGITDLVTPAVVRVEAVSHVEITLLDHVSRLRHVERSYDFPIGQGTGIVVNPDGAIVTLTRVVKTDDEDVAVRAANKVFADHHDVKVPQDDERHSVKDPILNRHLKDCYPPKRSTATCIIDVTTDITVFPNVSPADTDGFKAELVRAGSGPDSPAVLMPVARAVGSVGMPTAPLADKVPDQQGAPTSVAGFLGRPGPSVRTTVEIAHLGKGGSGENGRPFADPEKKVDEPVKLGGLADRGLAGAPVIGDKDGHVVGMLVGGGKEARMIGVREITSTLSKAGVAPRRGAIDSAFEAALTRYHTKYYTEAAPGFQRVLELYPGNVVAADLLKVALAKRGGPEDAGTRRAAAPASSGLPLWPFIVAAGVLFAGAAVGAFLLWRRRGAGDGPDDRQPPPLVPQQPAYDEGANQTIMVRRSQQFPVVPQQGQVLTTQQPATTFCTACGMRLGQAHRFCGYCGQPIETS
ncbi:hypothetical protein OUY22_28870 [Nonomuraea sp. MCN248]|uniref:Zinc ribbon domain-containing protein n=1 Tax=Nonomuraea corallina TaxID=2989783 RepID=A0ABT4SJN1_9ACTN|nr:hypothetical protein [Nonomuraea corallina]MDA0637437.1 hypothetical protein [Nonomuraea corallina]